MPRWGKDTVAKLYGGEIHWRLSDPGADEWVKALTEVKRRALNLQPFFDRFGAYMLNTSIPLNFAAEGRPKPWAQLSPEYRERKKARFGKRPILVISGAMQQAFKYTATARTLRIRNPKRYFEFHQRGAGNLPQRIMLLLQRQDRGVATRMLKRYLYESLEGL